jgi:transcriptional regulator with XRE-family HTH domain
MQLGLSLRDLGDQVGLSASYISDIERGNRTPTIETALAIGRALKQGDGEIAYFWVARHCGPKVLAALSETIRRQP